MLWFDILCASLAFLSFFYVRTRCAKIIAAQFVIQFIFDIVFIQFGLYEFVATRWFFLIKGLILSVTIYLIVRYSRSCYIVLLLFATMLYYYGLWVEQVFDLLGTGTFYRYFFPYMVLNSSLQILFLLGTTNAGSIVTRQIRRLYSRLRAYLNLDRDLRLSYSHNGGEER